MQLATSSAIAAGAGLSPSLAVGAAISGAGGRANRPNIVLIITDQERSPQYWPAGWADANLPNRKRLADHGLTFTRAFCNTAMCSPSRATLFTGLYPTQHGVEHTLTTGGSLSPNEPTLQPTTQNMARLLASAGYNVQYRGKWHLTKDVTCITDASSADDIEKFGFQGWQPPDAGQDTNPAHFGGGCADYDSRWAQQAADFLRSKEATSGQPFALIVSFVNPARCPGLCPELGPAGRQCPKRLLLQLPGPSAGMLSARDQPPAHPGRGLDSATSSQRPRRRLSCSWPRGWVSWWTGRGRSRPTSN